MLPSEKGAHFVLMFVECYTLPHFLRFAGGRAVCVCGGSEALGSRPFLSSFFGWGRPRAAQPSSLSLPPFHNTLAPTHDI